MAYLDGKVKRIIIETVKSRSIKKESIMVDPSLLECELISDAIDIRPPSSSPQPSSKMRSPPTYRKPKHYDARNSTLIVMALLSIVEIQDRTSLNQKVTFVQSVKKLSKDFLYKSYLFNSFTRFW